MLKNRIGTSHIELLLALAILSVAMYPLAYIFNIASPIKTKDGDEYIATLLAHHVMETIVAKRARDPFYLPNMSESKPVVALAASNEKISEYFSSFSEYSGPVTEVADPQLFWSLNKFSCSLDTYYLDENVFKIIVYISYQKDSSVKKVFFERLLPQKAVEVENFEGEAF